MELFAQTKKISPKKKLRLPSRKLKAFSIRNLCQFNHREEGVSRSKVKKTNDISQKIGRTPEWRKKSQLHQTKIREPRSADISRKVIASKQIISLFEEDETWNRWKSYKGRRGYHGGTGSLRYEDFCKAIQGIESTIEMQRSVLQMEIELAPEEPIILYQKIMARDRGQKILDAESLGDTNTVRKAKVSAAKIQIDQSFAEKDRGQ